MTAQSRILDFIEFKKISKREFYTKTGLSNGYLDKNSNLGSDKIEKIISIFPELNIEWLIMGTGTMLKQKGLLVTEENAPKLAKYLTKQLAETLHLNTAPISAPITAPNDENDNSNKNNPTINHIGRGVPVYNALATAGTTVLFDDEKEMAIGYIDMPAFNDCQGWVRVTGDSMYPKYRNGDYIAVKEQEDMSEITFGNAFYIILKEQKLLKYIRRHEKNNMIILRSENNKYDDLDLLRNKIVKLYRVKGLLRDID